MNERKGCYKNERKERKKERKVERKEEKKEERKKRRKKGRREYHYSCKQTKQHNQLVKYKEGKSIQ